MQLLTDKVFETDNSIKLMNLFYKSFSNKSSFSNFIKYEDFKLVLHRFIIEVMGLYLIDIKYSDDTYDVYIKELPKYIGGVYYDDKNALIINENVIREIYDGNLESFISILHELNHFKVKYDILDGIINSDICRCVKEGLLRDEDMNQLGFKSLKGDDFYYTKNYKNYSEEVYVEMCSKKDFSLFMRVLLIHYNFDSDMNIKVIDELMNKYIKDDLVRYNNHIRDLTMSLSFNSNYLSFNEVFDISVKYHPEWLKYPQISVEYYLDSDNNVKKKDVLQLRDDLSKIDDVATRDYVEYLIKNILNKEMNQGRGRG